MTRMNRIASSPVPQLLVSVRDAREAEVAAGVGRCLVDAKDPANGALGALSAAVVRAIVAAVGNRCQTSAVAGEPKTWDELLERVSGLAETGVDMVKVAWPRQGEAPLPAVQERMRGLPCPAVAVFFAEDRPTPSHVAVAARAGFSGAMIDTSVKDGRTLLHHLSTSEIDRFVSACRSYGMLAGLAGSLRVEHIPLLTPLRPTYLGFRGGLCRSNREGALDPNKIGEALSFLCASGRLEAVA